MGKERLLKEIADEISMAAISREKYQAAMEKAKTKKEKECAHKEFCKFFNPK